MCNEAFGWRFGLMLKPLLPVRNCELLTNVKGFATRAAENCGFDVEQGRSNYSCLGLTSI